MFWRTCSNFEEPTNRSHPLHLFLLLIFWYLNISTFFFSWLFWHAAIWRTKYTHVHTSLLIERDVSHVHHLHILMYIRLHVHTCIWWLDILTFSIWTHSCTYVSFDKKRRSHVHYLHILIYIRLHVHTSLLITWHFDFFYLNILMYIRLFWQKETSSCTLFARSHIYSSSCTHVSLDNLTFWLFLFEHTHVHTSHLIKRDVLMYIICTFSYIFVFMYTRLFG